MVDTLIAPLSCLATEGGIIVSWQVASSFTTVSNWSWLALIVWVSSLFLRNMLHGNCSVEGMFLLVACHNGLPRGLFFFFKTGDLGGATLTAHYTETSTVVWLVTVGTFFFFFSCGRQLGQRLHAGSG